MKDSNASILPPKWPPEGQSEPTISEMAVAAVRWPARCGCHGPSAEDVGKLVAAEEIGDAGLGLNGARQGMLHDGNLLARTEGRDDIRQQGREYPEGADDNARQPDAAADQVAIEAEFRPVSEGSRQQDGEHQPHWPEAEDHSSEDAEEADIFHGGFS
jgi:hypothetical protein